MNEKEEIIKLKQIIFDLTDGEDGCYHDHHGYCQAHAWFDTEVPCPYKRASEIIKTMRD
jgi:hypothetical protein